MSEAPTSDTSDTASASTRLRVRLEAIRYAAEGIHLFEFRAPGGQALPPFTAGAHIDLHLPNGLVRQYSLVGSPDRLDRYVVGVKKDPASRGGSSHLFERMKVGEQIDISAPRNHFPLVETAASSLLIAGGIGITPILCMARRLQQLGRDWRLVYSVRRRAEAAFIGELQHFGERVRLHVDEEHGGALLDVAAVAARAAADAHLYCCGPGPMLDAFEAATAARPAGHVHVERFTASAPAATEGGFVVELARSGRRLRVPPGQSIAAALLQAGVGVSVSCEQGVCGACETRVLAGIPDHRDSLLSPQEKAANDVMMICCSGSRSETLLLDL